MVYCEQDEALSWKRKDITMEFFCDRKYIILPASFHGVKKRLCFYSGDKRVLDLVVTLDNDQPDYHFPVDVTRFQGRSLRVTCEPDMDIRFEQSDEAVLDYGGKFRPLVHFTARRGWMNDPNGLLYYKGKYRMYFQHNPAATTWGNMHWGAAESEDLVHWQELGDVLFPDEWGTMFSGCGFVDESNLSGLKKGDETPLLFFYTCAGNTSETSKGQPFTQRLAYSLDGGKTLIKYSEHPVVPHIVKENRDPKVIRCPGGGYVMALYLDEHDFMLLKSDDLLHWQEIQRLQLPDDAECPDFYPLPTENGEKWVFSGASDRYLIGCFDGKQFIPETEQLRLNWGNGSYAAQSWYDLPDGRRIRTAFVNQVIPGMPFGCCMNLPQEMRLEKVKGQLRLCAWPVQEVEKLYLNTQKFGAFSVEERQPFCHPVNSKACDVTLKMAAGSSFRVSLYGMEIVYDHEQGLLRCGEQEAPVKGTDGTVELRMIFDTVYTEIFADKGSVFMGMTYIQDSNLNRLRIAAKKAEVLALTASELGAFYL